MKVKHEANPTTTEEILAASAEQLERSHQYLSQARAAVVASIELLKRLNTKATTQVQDEFIFHYGSYGLSKSRFDPEFEQQQQEIVERFKSEYPERAKACTKGWTEEEFTALYQQSPPRNDADSSPD